jgi:hypothetical protein
VQSGDKDSVVVDGSAVELDVEQSRPEPAAEVARVDVPGDVYRAMDVADEAQILDALQGNPSEVTVYKFQSGAKLQTGLSYAGVAEAAREMNQQGFGEIRISPVVPPMFEEVQEPDDKGDLQTYIQATVYAEDRKTGGGNFGTALQPKFMAFRDRSKAPAFDKFARAKALSKAQRNAMLPLIPVKFREVLIAQRLGDATRVKQIKMGVAAERESLLPPALVDDRALALVAEARGIYDEIKAAGIGWRVDLPPGRFQVKLEGAQHSHETLEALVGFLNGMLEHEQKAAQ